MIDKKDFESMKQEMEAFNAKRDTIIKDSRNVLKLSKQIINSLNRSEPKEAETLIAEIKKELQNLNKHTENHPELAYSPSYKAAVQEYVEAIAYYDFVKNKKLPTKKELGVDVESYLMGICDLTGELVRKAINSAIKQDYKLAFEINDFVSELYSELLKFDFINGNLRKKFDSIKYNLKKLEDLALELKLKEK
ncbi:hypothetical protein KY308_00750 [Candidatus Woesearchaeota archaeon]|nr:hypothetical protein [Candidatus Woesearchaeota archaeon]